ncbi:MAG: hypothetical protein JO354_03625 [Verrucomicrobia bacterium]|nr:hypothetical protein [Verrucomicrobiota bacterium]
MNKTVLSIALVIAAPFAWGQTTSETTTSTTAGNDTTSTTTTTTTADGSITEFTPGSTIVLKESSGPRTYHFGKKVVYVTKSGKVLDEEAVKSQIKVGVPVTVHYTGTGDDMMVDRVVVDED